MTNSEVAKLTRENTDKKVLLEESVFKVYENRLANSKGSPNVLANSVKKNESYRIKLDNHFYDINKTDLYQNKIFGKGEKEYLTPINTRNKVGTNVFAKSKYSKKNTISSNYFEENQKKTQSQHEQSNKSKIKKNLKFIKVPD